ncbi:MAG: hypothetical protein ACREVZ_14375 [Burkholderiales bacterium]
MKLNTVHYTALPYTVKKATWGREGRSNTDRIKVDLMACVRSPQRAAYDRLVASARDQRRRAVGAPLALVASGVTTSADRFIALLSRVEDGLADGLWEICSNESLGRVQVVVSRLVDVAQLAKLFGFGIWHRNVDLSALERSFIAGIVQADVKKSCWCCHVSMLPIGSA